MKTLVRAVALTFAFAAGAASAAYPERPITFVVPWGAGGGTDTTARYFAAMMEKELGQPVNVVNRTGGSGDVGHSAIAGAAPDGFTIGMITADIAVMHHHKMIFHVRQQRQHIAVLGEVAGLRGEKLGWNVGYGIKIMVRIVGSVVLGVAEES